MSRIPDETDHEPPDDGDPLATEDPLSTADPLATYDPDMTIDAIGDATEFGTQETPQATPEAFDLATLAAEDQSEIADVCSRFESAWDSGEEEPSVADFVPDTMESGLRQALVRQLVLLDIDYRKRKNLSLEPSVYLSELPDCGDAIRSAISQRRTSVPRGYGSVSLPKTLPDRHARSVPVSAHDPTSRYRATQLHARGGLGAVFRANDEELNRVVALKEILPDHASNRRCQDRFVFEAEVTGSLEHPGIVPIYGLGRYQDERPYYAMRFIRGKSFRSMIEAFHKENPTPSAGTYFGRDFRLLLRRLMESCNALHYAHEHGVLHRDIKPDNIMLGDYGETLVVDWGLAKLVDKRDENEQAGLTTTRIEVTGGGTRTSLGVAVGTPMYMSPEQAMGLHDQLDGRTDIYSLGAMLFNIVTGQHPIEGKSSREIVSNVRDGKVKHVTSVMPNAPKALASICRKAMATNAADRYPTAVDLADDLDRWMNDDIVQAHVGHEGVTEKIGRLIRRYRSWTISGAAALLVITAIAIISALLIERARQNEEIAKQEAVTYKKDAVGRYRDSRDAIDTWLVQSSDAMKFFPGTDSVRQRLLQLATEDYAKLAARDSGDPELELERGRAIVKLGDLLRRQANHQQAVDRYGDALKLFKNGFDDDEFSYDFQLEHGNVHTKLALANAGLDQIEASEREFGLAVEELSNLAEQRGDATTLKLLANAHVNAGQLLSILARHDEASDQLTVALDLYADITGDTDAQRDLGIAKTRQLLGDGFSDRGEHDRALQEIERSIEVLTRLVDAEPDSTEFLEALATAQVSKAKACRSLGNVTELFNALESASLSFRALIVALPNLPAFEENLAVALTDLGIAYLDADDHQNAKTALSEAHQRLTQLVTTHGQVPRLRQRLAVCDDVLGQVLLDLSDPPETATQLLSQASQQHQILLDISRRGLAGGATADPDQTRLQRLDYSEGWALAMSHYAQSLQRLNELPNAQLNFDASIDVFEQILAAQRLPRYTNGLAHVHFRYGMMLTASEPDRARQQFELALEQWLALGDNAAPMHQSALAWMLATCPDETIMNPAEALTHAAAAVKRAPNNPKFMGVLALATVLTGDPNGALARLNEAKRLRGHWTDQDLFVRAMAEKLNGEPEMAQQSLADGVDWMDDNRPFNADSKRLRQLAEQALEAKAK